MKDHLLFCIPHAGGTATAFARWRSAAPGVSIIAARLPGRLERWAEPALHDLDAIVHAVGAELVLRAARRFTLLGHSMGAIVAFELVRWLCDRGHVLPERLVVVGHDAPCVPARAAERRLGDLDDDQLLEALRSLGGLPSVVATNTELRALVLPAIRADVTALGGYVFRDGAPLPVEIMALAGTRDPTVSDVGLAAWGSLTHAAFSARRIPGDHFFLHERPATILRSLFGRPLNAHPE